MKISDIKRHVFRGFLSLHFVGLASTIGVRVASFGIYRATSAGDLQALSFGRDLVGLLARGLTLPGFLLTVMTGIAMVLLRYGPRPPVWVWIKVGLTTAALSLATPVVGPALDAARQWAHWSLEHGHSRPNFRPASQKRTSMADRFRAVRPEYSRSNLEAVLGTDAVPAAAARGKSLRRQTRKTEPEAAGESAMIEHDVPGAIRRRSF